MALIASVQIPNLAIAVARRDDPALRDTPMVLYTQERQRAVVVAASPDAGLTPNMPLRQALVRCPGAVYRSADAVDIGQVVITLTTLLQSFSPRVTTTELAPDAQIDIDLGDIDIPQTMTLMQRLAQHIHTTVRLVPALGVAATRFVAQRAAQQAGSGATVIVPPGEETIFLASHLVTTLGIPDDIVGRLQRFGLYTIGDLARLPLDALQAQFGGIGRTLYRLARGLIDEPIPATTEPLTLVRRGRFAGPLTNRTLLETTIGRLAARLTTQLATGGWAGGAIAVTLALEDGASWTAQRTLSTATADCAILTEAFLALSRTARLASGVEAVTLHVRGLVPTVVTQLDLFAPATGQAKQRDAALDRLRTRYASSFVRAHLDTPDAQQIERRVRLEPWEPR